MNRKLVPAIVRCLISVHPQERGSDVLGLSAQLGSDGLPYSTLSYANGLGYYDTYAKDGKRIDLTNADFNNSRTRYIATAPLDSETHGGDDVGIYASGPYAELFVGNFEQSNIPLLMAYAADIGPYAVDEKCSGGAILILTPLLISLAFVSVLAY